MSKGQIVTVKLYGGKTATRRVVAVKRDVIVICTEQEFNNAKQLGIEPTGLGFPREDVLDLGTPTKIEPRSERANNRMVNAGD